MKARIKLFVQRTSLFVVATLVLVGFPNPAASADTTPAPAPSTASTTTTGPQKPNGSDAKTYTYNATTGLWENAYYTWDPATGKTTPKTPQDYSYNPATGMWDTPTYKYDTASGTYVPNTPPAPTAPTATTANNTAPSTAASTGPGSSTVANATAANDQTYNGFYNASISNKTTSQALSGNATVASNTTGGDATSGNATDTSTILNLLQSSASFIGSNGISTFTSAVNGNVVGDLLLDPALIMSLQPASDSSSTNSLSNNLTVNNNASTAINNDITVGATSGDATVNKNTSGGSATTGDANAIANVINVANSDLTAGQTFIGTINIYGNLDGDILLPANLLQSLVASNGPGSNATIASSTTNDLGVHSAVAQTIDNNVVTSAVSGNATVANNTSAGNGTTGNANTNVTLLNLTGHKLVAADSLLVFVNVLGNWVGLIMDAPTGATSAALAGNVSSDTTMANTADITDTSTTAITNKVNVKAQSGDASVTNNTSAGDATSGNATASANILNIANDNLTLSNWFGVLFINVFGTWSGSFGVNTAAGTRPTGTSGIASNAMDKGDKPYQSAESVVTNIADPTIAHEFASVLGAQTDDNGSGSATNTSNTSLVASKQKTVLGAATSVPAWHRSNNNWQFTAIGLSISVGLVLIERIIAFRKRP